MKANRNLVDIIDIWEYISVGGGDSPWLSGFLFLFAQYIILCMRGLCFNTF